MCGYHYGPHICVPLGMDNWQEFCTIEQASLTNAGSQNYVTHPSGNKYFGPCMDPNECTVLPWNCEHNNNNCGLVTCIARALMVMR